MRCSAFLVLLLICCSCYAENAIYTSEDSLRICRLLAEGKGLKTDDEVVLFYADKFKGIPYVGHTLEGNKEEMLVVNTEGFDCTTFVETVSALAICTYNKIYSFDGFCMVLRNLRYREGGIDGYESRLHYFSEWIEDNEMLGYVCEQEGPQSLFSAKQIINVDYMTTHPNSYRALRDNPALVEKIKLNEDKISGTMCLYIPKEKCGNSILMREVIKDGDILAITCNIKGLDIAHLGFAKWIDGKLYLLHASSKYKRVCEQPEDLKSYLLRNKKFTGIRVVRLNKTK